MNAALTLARRQTLHSVIDAAATAELLRSPGKSGYQPGCVRLLDNAEATNQAIQEALAELAIRSDHTAVVLDYVSDSGGRISHGPTACHYLIPVDANASSAMALAASSIFGDGFAAALSSSISSRR